MSKRVRVHPVAIGAFAAGAVGLAIAGLLFFGATKVFARKFPVVMFFDENVNGLMVGAPVAYRGVRLGEVTEIQSLVGTSRIAVAASLERGPLLTRENTAGQGTDHMRRTLEEAITKGLRGQIALQSLLTGQLYVSLVLRPDTPASLVGLAGGALEIPTIPTIIAQLEAGLQKVPLVELPKHLYDTVQGTARLLQAPELGKAIDSVGPLLADAQTLLRRLDTEVGPLVASLKGTSDTARASLVDVTRRLDSLMADLQPEANRLVTSLADTSDTAREALAGTAQEVKQLGGRTGTLITSLTETSDTARGAVKDVAGDLKTALAQLGSQVAALTVQLGSVSDRAQATLQDMDGALTGDSPLGYQVKQTLQELAAAARSLQTLADYLERNPESLLAGKARVQDAR